MRTRWVYCFCEGYFGKWTNYLDMRIGLFTLSCAICASGVYRIWLFWPLLSRQLPVQWALNMA
jgi:hypothetical protein